MPDHAEAPRRRPTAPGGSSTAPGGSSTAPGGSSTAPAAAPWAARPLLPVRRQILRHRPSEGDEVIAAAGIQAGEEGGDVGRDGLGLGHREVEGTGGVAVPGDE